MMLPHFLELFNYIRHDEQCEFTQPMWHQGPCDCGLHDLMDKLSQDLLNEIPENIVTAWRDAKERREKWAKEKVQ